MVKKMYNPQLETFIHAADAGSFSKAADKLHVSPTAIIKQINILEADLGLKLFTRTYRGITLTEAGKSLYNDAKYIIQYSKDSVARAKDAAPGANDVIRIGTSPLTSGQFLIDLWPKLHELCPETKFKLVPYENTPENAREIMKNLGRGIDIVAGYFDNDGYLDWRGCAALELSREPIRCAVPVSHRLAREEKLELNDLYGENLLFIKRGWNSHADRLRDDLLQNHRAINIVDFEFFNLSVFNHCENTNSVLMTVDHWKNVHPLLKILPVEWEHILPFGILHSPSPSQTVSRFLEAVQSVNL
jgi:DNA-binding transcriptional LysR family regulator